MSTITTDVRTELYRDWISLSPEFRDIMKLQSIHACKHLLFISISE